MIPLVSHRRQLAIWCALAGLGVLPMAGVLPLEWWWTVLLAFAVVSVLDGVGAFFLSVPTISRRVRSAYALGVEETVALQVENRSRLRVELWLFDRVPATTTPEGLPIHCRLASGKGAELNYFVFPTARGQVIFEGVDTRMRSVLGLWWRQFSVPNRDEVRVYPNFRAVARYALLATHNRTSLLGIRRRQRRGVGTEFQELRDYQPGDGLRNIDWRATSRVRRLVARDYRDERDQQIVFLVDSGRRMHSRDGVASHLDHALNAVLLLGHVALAQGDSVGLMTFGGQERWLAPAKGQTHLNTMLNTLFDLQTDPVPADVESAIERVLRRVRKRTFIVVVTNLRDETDDSLGSSLRFASRRHLVLLASLREIALHQALDAPIDNFDDALRYASTQHFVHERTRAHTRLAMAGVLHLDVAPQQLAVQLVNQYLEVKASGR
ncbi:MAG: DUF58 domain-containing protein, partial [Myxococcota bacterium]